MGKKAVPFTFLASALVFLLTRNLARAASVLVVDFSCALKLATPLAIKSAVLESATHGAIFKGGKHLETLANADVFVFDKTGTLTAAKPRIAGVYPLNGFTRKFVLRNAACLEEHFPHPVARAIVDQAIREKLDHEERHSEVEYILAHGITSSLQGQRVLIGSRHFVEEHEQIDLSQTRDIANTAAKHGHGILYFVVGEKVAGVIAIDDPMIPEAPRVIRQLQKLGISRLVLMTGDGQQAAETIGRNVGLTEIYYEVLPDQKTDLIERFKAEGLTVAMIGDGINDSAALAVADVGISLKHASDIAQEVSDVLLHGALQSLPDAVLIARRALSRVQGSFRFSVAANSVLMLLGLAGIAPTSLLALLHNGSTVGTCMWSLRPLVPQSATPSHSGMHELSEG